MCVQKLKQPMPGSTGPRTAFSLRVCELPAGDERQEQFQAKVRSVASQDLGPGLLCAILWDLLRHREQEGILLHRRPVYTASFLSH